MPRLAAIAAPTRFPRGAGAQTRLYLGRPAEALDSLVRAGALHAAHDRVEGAGDTIDWIAARALRQLGQFGEALVRIQAAIEVARSRRANDVAFTLVERAQV